MDRSNLAAYYEANVGLIHSIALPGYGRLADIGGSQSYDDLFQELTEVFIKAYDAFDENAGFTFSTYFMTSARNYLNHNAEQVEVERLGVKTSWFKSDEIDPKTGKRKWKSRRERVHQGCSSFEEMSARADSDEADMHEIIPAHGPTPEQIASIESDMRVLMARLSPLARQMLAMVIDPPDYLEREFDALDAHARLARSMNIRGVIASGRIDLPFVSSFMERTLGIPAAQLRKARYEVTGATKQVIYGTTH